MTISYNMNWGNLFEGVTDEDMYREEVRIGILADKLGFDTLWSVEHHFSSYAMCPSNFQVLAHLAGRTSRAKLGLGAVILPWHDPLRVIEDVAQLDILTEGRLLLAFGRGLAKDEYDGFRVDMSESRERFDEAARFVLNSLVSGYAEYEGKFYRQPRVQIRPRPPRTFDGRFFAVATSIDSVRPVAELGAAMTCFIQQPIEAHMPAITSYRDIYRETFGKTAPLPTLTDFIFCHEDSAEAERMARHHIGTYFMSVINHYRLFGNDFAGVKGYDAYDKGAAMLRAMGKEAVLNAYINAQLWGTPAEILEKYERRLSITGGHNSNLTFSYGAMPYDQVERSMRLFADQVMPSMRSLDERQIVAR